MRMIRVLLYDPFRENHLGRFRDLDGFSFELYRDESQLAGAEVILGNPSPALLAKAPRVKWVQICSAGSDAFFGCPELFENRTLTNLSGAFGQSISEFALTMTLMLYKHMHLFRDRQRAHVWADVGRQDSPVGKNVLILGAGDIGTRTAELFSHFGCHITGMRRTPRDVPPPFEKMITADGLDMALPEADIVICALPGTKETYHLLDARRLGLMKQTAVLVNVGRGGLIDSLALADALNSGRLGGAAIDVTDPEPLPADHPLWDCENLILTPHITGKGFGHLTATEEKLFEICRENLRRYRDGEALMNRVDMKQGYRVTDNRI